MRNVLCRRWTSTRQAGRWTFQEIISHKYGIADCSNDSTRFYQLFARSSVHSAASASQIQAEIERRPSYDFWYRPFLVLYRAMLIMSEMAMLSSWHVIEKDISKRAAKMRQSLVRLGPFYIKLGQALSTRPDILPHAYCVELSKLQDQIPPFPTSKAMKYMEAQLGAPIKSLYAEISEKPLAAASLGQVYKARLHSGEIVAVKVLRPHVSYRLALDAQLLHLVGGQLQWLAGARGDLIAVVNEMVDHMMEETNYIFEGKNADRFNSLYGIDFYDNKSTHSGNKKSEYRVESGSSEEARKSREALVKVPKIYWSHTTEGVLTMEWIDGIKLTDRESLLKANLNIQQLVDQGVFCSLRQLLVDGYFHADPHPGNLVATKDGILAYFDFGMMSDLPRPYRIGLIRTLVHFVNRDATRLAEDFSSLGFIPEGTELGPIAEALQESFGDETTRAQLDFQGIMSQLSDVMYDFNFRLPPEFGLVIRALGSLEGTATTLDPDFKVIESAYPFIVGRLLSDPDPDMRKILQELLIRNNGSIRWHRLERLVVAISEQLVEEKEKNASKTVGRIRRSFDTRVVASATADLIDFILSEKSVRVRMLIVRDIAEVIDVTAERIISSIRKVPVDDAINVNSIPKDEPTADQYRPMADRSIKVEVMQFRQEGIFSRVKLFSWGRLKAGRKKIGVKWKGPEKGPTTGQEQDAAKKEQPINASTKSHQDKDLLERVVRGLSAFLSAVNSAPEIWIPLLLRVMANREAQKLFLGILSAVSKRGWQHVIEALLYLLSRILHVSGI